MKIFNYKIIGMHCTGCAMNIELSIEEVPGVKKVEVDYASARMKVEAESSVSEKEILAVVQKAGYQAKAEPATS